MKHARIVLDGIVHAATEAGPGLVRLPDGRVLAEDQVQWLPPIEPRTTFTLAINYADHARNWPSRPRRTGGLPEGRQHLRRPPRPHFPSSRRGVHALRVRAGRGYRQDRPQCAPRSGLRPCGRLHRGQRLRTARLPGELVPPQPARQESRHLHAAGPLAGGPRRHPGPHEPGAVHPRQRRAHPARQHARHGVRRARADRVLQQLHDALARRSDPDRHARRHRQREARRRGRDRNRRGGKTGQHPGPLPA